MALLLFIYLVVCYFCAKFGNLRLIYTLLVWGFCMGWKLGWSKGLVIAIFWNFLCFSVWLQCAYNSAKSKNRFQLWDKWDNYWRHGDSLLFSLACAQVTKFHTYNTGTQKGCCDTKCITSYIFHIKIFLHYLFIRWCMPLSCAQRAFPSRTKTSSKRLGLLQNQYIGPCGSAAEEGQLTYPLSLPFCLHRSELMGP